MKIIAVTPFHLRPHISKIFWQNAQDIGLDVIALVSDEENKRMAMKNAFKTIVTQNNPLGLKWQTGVEALRSLDFDYLLIVGSDDITSHKAIRLYERMVEEGGHEYIGFEDAIAMDFRTKRFRHFKGYTNHRLGESIGANRLVSKKLLEKIDYRVFPTDRHKYMDGVLTKNLKKIGVENVLVKSGMQPYRMGVKTGLTLSKVYPNSPFRFNISLDGWYSEEVIKMLLEK